MSETNDTVTYKEIPGFPGYRVGDDGSVWTCKRFGGRDYGWLLSNEWKLLTPCPHYKSGYLYVNLAGSSIAVHRLVLTAFSGPRPTGTQACHNPDPSKSNNRIGNLRWDVPSENMADMERQGRRKRGLTHQCAKLAAEQVVSIRKMVADGATQEQAAAAFGVSVVPINHIVTGRGYSDVGGPIHKVKQHTKLTPEQVREIRGRRLAGEKLAPLAAEFGITQTTICAIALGKTRAGVI
jgi:hypothetical protein